MNFKWISQRALIYAMDGSDVDGFLNWIMPERGTVDLLGMICMPSVVVVAVAAADVAIINKSNATLDSSMSN